MDFWNDKDNEYRLKMIDVYNEQVNELVKLLPTFKIANATIKMAYLTAMIMRLQIILLEK